MGVICPESTVAVHRQNEGFCCYPLLLGRRRLSRQRCCSSLQLWSLWISICPCRLRIRTCCCPSCRSRCPSSCRHLCCSPSSLCCSPSCLHQPIRLCRTSIPSCRTLPPPRSRCLSIRPRRNRCRTLCT